MSALEREIVEKFQQLDKDAQKRVLKLIAQEADTTEKNETAAFDYDAWFAELDKVRVNLRPDPSGHVPSASELVNEVREERDAEILRSLGFRDSSGNSSE